MKLQKKIFADLSELPIEKEEKYLKLFHIFKTRAEERSGVSVSDKDGDFTVRFSLDGSMAEEAFDISDIENGLLIKGGSFTVAAFLAGAVTNAVPGIIVQIVLIPILVMLLDNPKILKR